MARDEEHEDVPGTGEEPDESRAAGDPAEPDQDLPDDARQPGGVFRGPGGSRKVWMLLSVILVVIAVSVLYVYQAGDRKTILGNQPIPTDNQQYLYAQPAAQVAPVGVRALNVPGGGQLSPSPLPALPGPAVAGGTVQCPRCGTQGLPICGSCNSVMRRLDRGAGSELYVCPRCGAVGVPLCPNCRSAMTSSGSPAPPAVAPAAVAASPGGQFVCPACGATGMPNWDAGGTPLCPNCRSRMQVSGATGAAGRLAAGL